jgi:hypothetical protein
VKSNIAAQQVGAWVEELQQVMQATFVCIEGYLQTQMTVTDAQPLRGGPTVDHGNSTKRAEVLESLLAQLRAGVLTDNPAKVEQHMPALAELMPGADLPQLQTLLDAFDFEAVRQWIDSLEIDLRA